MKNNTRFIVLCLVGLAAWFVQAMTFVDLVHPDEVLLDDSGSGRVMEVGVAPRPAGGWYLVIACAAA